MSIVSYKGCTLPWYAKRKKYLHEIPMFTLTLKKNYSESLCWALKLNVPKINIIYIYFFIYLFIYVYKSVNVYIVYIIHIFIFYIFVYICIQQINRQVDTNQPVFWNTCSCLNAIRLKKNFMSSFYGWGSTVSKLQSNNNETVYFLPFISQKFLVLNCLTLEGSKAELTLQLPSGFETRTLGLQIQCLKHQVIAYKRTLENDLI